MMCSLPRQLNEIKFSTKLALLISEVNKYWMASLPCTFPRAFSDGIQSQVFTHNG